MEGSLVEGSLVAEHQGLGKASLASAFVSLAEVVSAFALEDQAD